MIQEEERRGSNDVTVIPSRAILVTAPPDFHPPGGLLRTAFWRRETMKTRATRASVRAGSLRKNARSIGPVNRNSQTSAFITAATLINAATATQSAPPTVQYVDPIKEKMATLGKLCWRRDRMQQQIITSSVPAKSNQKSLKRMNKRILQMQKQLNFSPTVKDVRIAIENCANKREHCFRYCLITFLMI